MSGNPITIDDLVAQYRDFYHDMYEPLLSRRRDMLAMGASEEFAFARCQRDMEASLRKIGWTPRMLEQFGTLDRLQRLRRLALKHPGKVLEGLGESLVTALLERGHNGGDETVHVFRLADGRVITARGADIPDLRCPLRSRDREGLDPPTPENERGPGPTGP